MGAHRILLVLAAVAVVSAAGAAGAQNAGDDEVAKILERARSLTARVEQQRELKVRRPIQRGVMDRDGIRARLLERIDEEYTPEELAAEELALERLGLLPEGTDYKQLVLDLLTEQIAGFYDPHERKLYLGRWQTGLEGDAVISHETCHALQDQHFGLAAFMEPNRDNGDETVAHQALVEGDCTALMIEAQLPDGAPLPWATDAALQLMEPAIRAQAETGALAKAPLILREGLLFPYWHGLKFVAHFRRTRPWKRIDAMFRKPPLSSEHILHPAKYEAYERPDQVAERALPALRGYERAYHDVSGQWGLEVLLRAHGVDDDKARRAATGWGGDRLVVYTPPAHNGNVGGAVAVSYSVWDAEADAMEMFDALTHALPILSRAPRVASRDGYVEYKTRAGVFSAERRGDAIVLLVGAPPARADDIRAQVWRHWKARRR